MPTLLHHDYLRRRGRVVATPTSGATHELQYDVSGRRTKVIDALSHETLLTYDASGKPEDCEDPKGTAHHLRVRTRRTAGRKTIFRTGRSR